MSTTYTDFFTGKTVTPAFPQYSTIALTGNITLSWPNQFQNTNSVVSVIMDITPNAGGRTVTMPDAREVGTGFTFKINNPGLFDFNLLDNTGGLIATIQTLKANEIWLRSNSTPAGTWANIPAFGGAGAVNSVNATSDSDNLVITGVPITTSGTIVLSLQQDLLALTQFPDDGVGFPARIGLNAWSLRNITGTANQIIVNNQSGIAGNPTFLLAPNITGVTSLTLAGLTFGVGAANRIGSNVNTNIEITPGGTGIIALNTDTKLAEGKHLKFLAENGVNYVTFRAGASVINQDFIWPTAAPLATQVLGFAGGSTLSWVNIPTTTGASTIDALARFSNTVGGIKDSLSTLTDAGELTVVSYMTPSLKIGGTTGSEHQTIATRTTNLNLIIAPDGIGSVDCKGDFWVRPSQATQRKLRLYNQAGTLFTGLISSNAIVADATWTLPTTAGTAGYFVTDTANAMSIRGFPVTVADNLAKFSGIAGEVADAGIAAANVVTNAGASTANAIAIFSGVTGKIITNGTTTLAQLLPLSGGTMTGGIVMGANAVTGTGANTAGTLALSTATASTSTITGALTVAGGIGVALKAYIGGALNVTDATDSSSVSTGSGIFTGGIGLAKALTAGGIIKTTATTASTSTITGALISGGGLGVAGNVYAGGKFVSTVTSTVHGLDLATTDAYANLRVIQNTTASFDKHIYLGIGSATPSSILMYSNANRTMTVQGGNVAIHNGDGSYGGGAGVIFIGNCTTAPTTAPVGGGILYVEGGALKYRGTISAPVTIAPA